MKTWYAGKVTAVKGSASGPDLDERWDGHEELPTTTAFVVYDDGEEAMHDLGSKRRQPWEWVLDERPPGKAAGAWLSGTYKL